MGHAESAEQTRSAQGAGLGRPGGPRGLPLLGNLLSLADPLEFFSDCAATHGDLVWMNLAGWPALLVNDIDAIEKILVKEHRDFVKNSFFWRHVTAVFGNGILTSEGDFWHRQRRLAAPSFAGKRLLSYDRDMVALTGRMLKGWREGDVMDVHPEMMGLTLRIAAKTLFDTEVEQDIADMEQALDDLIMEVAARFKRPVLIPDAVPLPGHLRYRRAIRTVERVVARVIEERRRTGYEDRPDFLSRLMAARDDDGHAMSDKQLRDEAITLLLAGHETTALALSWTFFLLGQHPQTSRRVADEVAQVLEGRPVTSQDLPNLKFTESVLWEAMRLYPPAWGIGRESTAPFQLGEYSFPKGVTIFISPWVLHRNARYFDDPETFRPERWLDGLHERLPRFAFMPFGGGPRICIGHRFAMMEAMLILSTIVQAFQLEWLPEHPVKPFPSITLRPQGGVWVRLSGTEAGRTLH